MSNRNVGLPELPPLGPPASAPDAIRRRLDELTVEAQTLIRGKQSLTPEEMARFRTIIDEMVRLMHDPANIIPGLDGGRRRSRRRRGHTRKHKRRH